MKRIFILAALVFPLAVFSGCGSKPETSAPMATEKKPADLAALVGAVPTGGPRAGNNYKVFFLVLRQNQQPATGFKVEAWVKGKSEPLSKISDASGLITFENLPFPEAKQHLNAIFHYYRGQADQAREIDYPYIESDAYRLKDTQYIPNDAIPDPS